MYIIYYSRKLNDFAVEGNGRDHHYEEFLRLIDEGEIKPDRVGFYAPVNILGGLEKTLEIDERIREGFEKLQKMKRYLVF